MQVKGEMKDNAFVVSIQGRIDMDTSSEFNTTLESYLEANFTPFILNCKDLEYINSSGLSSLINLSQMLERFQLKLLLCELQPAVKEVIEIAGMNDHFNIFPTEQAAFGSL
ncbi:MAG: STAS domain-containing protein [Nitrospinae bacterium]|nr:STAS domain-containing protein [Nitrospinota bacterium]